MDDGTKKSNFELKGKGNEAKDQLDLDDVLVNELGQFGPFQVRTLLLIGIPIILSAFLGEYIFTAAAIPHRCRITECGEDNKSKDFEPSWIINAIPQTKSGFASCERYAPSSLEVNGTLNYCPASIFDPNITTPCEEYVYSKDNTVVYDFNLGCSEWLRALAGTLQHLGTFVALPITGILSDRFGRRIPLILNVFNMAVIGIIKSFSVNYTMYLALQIVQSTLSGAIFSSAYIIVAELVGPNYRVISSSIATSMFSIGQVTLGLIAWLIQPWRTLILVLYAPSILIIGFYWILPESVRWLLSKHKYDEARKVLENIARVNKTKISSQSMKALTTPKQNSTATSKVEHRHLLKRILRSPVLLRRVCTIPIWWITTTFVYYGLSINSTNIFNTVYLNYILTCAIEIPGYITAVFILDRIGRRATLSFGYFLSAICNISFIFISSDLATIRLLVYLLGKFGIAIVVTSVYLFTSELYPTEFRHTLLGFSSMIGRIGSVSAPLAPALMQYWVGLPNALFGGLSVLSGILVLTQPETLGIKLPDTLAEAEALGTPEYKQAS